MKKAINELARSFAPMMYMVGQMPSPGERFRQFLVRVTDEKPELFKNHYLMKAAERLQQIYPILSLEDFYEFKRQESDHVFDQYEKALRAYVSTGDPKNSLRALRDGNIELRDRFHRMVTSDTISKITNGKNDVYEALIEVDMLADISFARFVRDADELVAVTDNKYDLKQILEDLNISVETREDFEALLDKRDVLMEHKGLRYVAQKLSSAITPHLSREDRIEPQDIRRHFELKNSAPKDQTCTPASVALPGLMSPANLAHLISAVDTPDKLELEDIKSIMDTYGQDLAPFNKGAESFEALLAVEQASMTDFMARMDSSRYHGELGRLPYADEEVEVERSPDGMILRARIIEEKELIPEL